MPGFIDLNLRQELVDKVKEIGWEMPTEIQEIAIPEAIQGKDIIGIGKTGTGKTGAYLLSMLHIWLEKEKPIEFSMILTPTRELASQINDDLIELGQHLGLKTLLLVGGNDSAEEIMTFKNHDYHVIIGTCGRICNLYYVKKDFQTYFHSIRFLILDEADQLLDYEFGGEVNKLGSIIADKPSNKTIRKKMADKKGYLRQTLAFSATFTTKIDYFVKNVLCNPKIIGNESQTTFPNKLQHYYLNSELSDREVNLFALLFKYQLESEKIFPGKPYKAIVFVKSCKETAYFTRLFAELKFTTAAVHSRMSKMTQKENIDKFRNGEIQVLVATDIAARGLHIEEVMIVVNLDLPHNADLYRHRVGRTARLDNPGVAVTFIFKLKSYVKEFIKIESQLGITIEEFPKMQMKPAVTEAVKQVVRGLKKQLKRERVELEEQEDDLDEDDETETPNRYLSKRMRIQ